MLAMSFHLLAGARKATAFRAYNCNSQSVQVEKYSLLDPELCGTKEKAKRIE
jgi:hypothetical protein